MDSASVNAALIDMAQTSGPSSHDLDYPGQVANPSRLL